ncbi:MAG: cytochrome b/b6 domain-containing protein [Thermodesulfobacteriota bacterium]
MTTIAEEQDQLDFTTLVLHAGITVFGLAAWLTGEWAGDYQTVIHAGFEFHRFLGICLSLCILGRLLYGVWGPDRVRWSVLVPLDLKDWLASVQEDLQALLKLEFPDRPRFWGIKGAVQLFGLLVFSWMAFTGSLLFTYLHPGHKAHGVLYLLKEMHEIGKTLIPVFLALHLLGVLLDALWGRKKWRRVLFLEQ